MRKNINRITHTCLTVGLLHIAFLAAAYSPASYAQSKTYEGYWVTPNYSSVVEVSQCENSLCAKIAWLWDVTILGKRMQDTKNPSSAKQKRSLVGISLFSNFKQDGKNWKGKIYNPEDGRNYRASVRALNQHALRLKGCWGPFCQSQTWFRLSSVVMPTEASLARGK